MIFAADLYAGGATSQDSAEASAPEAQTTIEAREDGRLSEEFLVLPLGASGDAAAYADALALDLSQRLDSEGFAVIRAASLSAVAPGSTLLNELNSGAISERDLAMDLATRAGRRYIGLAFVQIENGRALWRASLFDAASQTLLSSAGGAAFAGLSVLPLLTQSAEEAASQAVSASRDYSMEGLVDYRLRFSGMQDGVSVHLGSSEEGRLLGQVEEGELVLSYLPFRLDSVATLTAAKEGYWPVSFAVALSAQEPQNLVLPQLMPVSDGALYFALRYPGPLGLTVGARWNLIPDQIFIKAENSLWFATSLLPGSRAIIHNETRAAFGTYLFLPRNSIFRISASLGVSAIQTIVPFEGATRPYNFDVLLDPVALSIELHLQHLAPFVELRLPFSLGLDPGLLPLGWVKAGDFPFMITLGVLNKW